MEQNPHTYLRKDMLLSAGRQVGDVKVRILLYYQGRYGRRSLSHTCEYISSHAQLELTS